MSITLSNLSYGQVALYSLFFGIICFVAIILIAIYSLISKKIKKFFVKYFEKQNEKNNLIGFSPGETNYYKRKNKINIRIRAIKITLNWLEKIIGITFVLFLVLMMIRWLITDDTFAYTIITLIIFIMSNNITSFIRSSWASDKHVFSPVIAIGERVIVENTRGMVASIGKDFFYVMNLKKNNKETECQHHRFPLSILDYSKLTKIEPKNITHMKKFKNLNHDQKQKKSSSSKEERTMKIQENLDGDIKDVKLSESSMYKDELKRRKFGLNVDGSKKDDTLITIISV